MPTLVECFGCIYHKARAKGGPLPMCSHPRVEEAEFLKVPIEDCYTKAKSKKGKQPREDATAAGSVVDETAPPLSVPTANTAPPQINEPL
jgi:hypothetical protein